MATIRDVANKSGVSVASVSRYINKKGYVSKETAELIQAAINDLNYRPNEVARSLYQKKSKLIGLLITDISNPFFPILAKGVEDEVRKAGYTLILGNTGESTEVAENYLQTFVGNNVSGLISTVAIDNDYSIPHILLDREWGDGKNTVISDHYQGGVLTAEEILKTTYKQIVIMVGPLEVKSTEIRLKGILDVFQKQNISYELMYTETFDFSGVDKVTKEFFKLHENADTIIASNDIYALSIMREHQLRGNRIPEDVQIIGYDGISFLKMSNPQLTTIYQPAYEMGKVAANKLLKKITGVDTEFEKVLLPVSLEKGETLRYFEK